MEEIEVPLEQSQEDIHHHAHHSPERWVLYVALSSALIAAFAAVTALLAGHHANEAMIEQMKASDTWSQYQSKGIKSQGLETRMKILAAFNAGKTGSPPAADAHTTPAAETPGTAAGESHAGEKAAGEKLTKEGKKKLTDAENIARYAHEQEELMEKAREFEGSSTSHMHRHSVLANGVTLFQVAIAIAAISVLTKRHEFFLVGLLSAVGGVCFLAYALLHAM